MASEEVKMAEAENSRMELEKIETREINKESNEKKVKVNNKKKYKLRNLFIPRFGCMKLEDEYPTIDEQAADGSFNMQATDRNPTHLIVMVNGIIGRSVLLRLNLKLLLLSFNRTSFCSFFTKRKNIILLLII